MNNLNYHREALKRQRVDHGATAVMQSQPSLLPPTTKKLLGLSMTDADVTSAIVPPVTVVLEGRSICQRISLTRHASYQSLAAALHRMFVDVDEESGESKIDGAVDLSNAVPGHMVAYEDMEDDLLLAGDLSWKDFVRVVKRIRIIPAKSNRRKKLQRA